MALPLNTELRFADPFMVQNQVSEHRFEDSS